MAEHTWLSARKDSLLGRIVYPPLRAGGRAGAGGEAEAARAQGQYHDAGHLVQRSRVRPQRHEAGDHLGPARGGRELTTSLSLPPAAGSAEEGEEANAEADGRSIYVGSVRRGTHPSIP